MFSPYYAWARRRGAADPRQHCALNVALYGPRGKRWALTERGAAMVEAHALGIGPSRLAWRGDALEIAIDEMTCPLPTRIRGTVRLYPGARTETLIALDAAGRHLWAPLAPCARVEVALDRPALRWSGAGYLDHNAGTVPLEADFTHWHWSRADVDGATGILYDVTRRDGSALSVALRADAAGRVAPMAAPPMAILPASGWRVARATRSDAGHPATVLRTLEDTPFYARSLVAAQLNGVAVQAMHESLSLDRFARPWVQMLLPFRMPRRKG